MIRASLSVVRDLGLLRVTIRTDDRVTCVTTPCVFVGNNDYELSPPSLGRRSRLDAGQLNVHVANVSSRSGLARLALYAAIGQLHRAEAFESWCVPEVEIETERRRLRVARDGEVTVMQPPLRYRVRPRALRVVVPAPPT